MKKTLIALAAVAVSGAAMAQATISGNYTAGFQSTKSAANAKASGLGVDTAEIRFSASEDLGGGLRASVSMGLENMYNWGMAMDDEENARRIGLPTNLNSSIALSGGFGSVTLANTNKTANGIAPLAAAGAPVLTNKTTGFTDGDGTESLTYMSPDVMPGLKLGLQMIEGAALQGPAGTDCDAEPELCNVDADFGLGKGQKNALGQTATLLLATYKVGAIDARIDYTKGGKKSLGNRGRDSRTRISGNYDLGVAKVGAGYSTDKAFSGTKNNQYMFGVSVPVGAFTLGAAVQSNTAKTVANVKTKSSGNSFGVEYALSKRTSVIAQTASWKTKPARSARETNLLVSHSF